MSVQFRAKRIDGVWYVVGKSDGEWVKVELHLMRDSARDRAEKLNQTARAMEAQ